MSRHHRSATIHRLELAEPFPDLPADGHDAFVECWHHDLLLAALHVPSRRLPLHAERLAHEVVAAVRPAVREHLESTTRGAETAVDLPALPDPVSLAATLEVLSERLRLPPDSASDVSVVICTRDRPEPLAACLTHLEQLRHRPLEIIVVDNASATDATRSVAASHGDVRYVRENRPGLDVARNTGIRESRGAVVAFTDDDVRVHPDWAGRVGSLFRDEALMAATGQVLPAELTTEAQLHFERFWSLGKGCVPRTYGPTFFRATRRTGVPVWDVGAGANMAFRRSVFDDVGLFDERLDVGAAGCSGDSEIWYRILAAGHWIRYEPTAVVHHYHRRDMEGLARQLRAYMRGHSAAVLVQFEKHREWGDLRWLLGTLPRHYARRAAHRLRHGPTDETLTVYTELAGYLAGLRYYLGHHRIGRGGDGS